MPTALAHRGPNTTRLAKRFFWKECRRLAGLTIGVFLLSLALMAVLWWFTPQGFGLVDGLTVIAVGGGAMLAVAAAVTLFSVEKEEGTAELLGWLPRNIVAMTVGKLGAAAIVVPFCTAALLLMAWWIAGVTPDSRQVNTVVLPQASLFLLEAFVWSLVASLACPNPLVAAVLGIALSSVSVQIGLYLENPDSRGVTSEALSAAAPERLVMAAIGMLMAGSLVSKWPTPLRVHRAAETTTLKEPTRKNPRATLLGAFGRLFWQTIRQSWVTGVVATLLGLFLTFMGVLILNGMLSLNFGWSYVSGYGALFAPAMLGAVVFRADQRRGAYRFLAEHAGLPRMLWLARNTAGLTLLTLCSLFIRGGAGRRLVVPRSRQDELRLALPNLAGRRVAASDSGRWRRLANRSHRRRCGADGVRLGAVLLAHTARRRNRCDASADCFDRPPVVGVGRLVMATATAGVLIATRHWSHVGVTAEGARLDVRPPRTVALGGAARGYRSADRMARVGDSRHASCPSRYAVTACVDWRRQL
jgi:hypothetical protein